jgi:hypothetical protein
VSTVDGLFLVLEDLAVELVDQCVDGGVEVVVGGVREHVPALDVDRRLRFLQVLLELEDDVDVRDVLEVRLSSFANFSSV